MAIIIFLVIIALIVNIIKPDLVWYLDAWKYDSDKPEPSDEYIIIVRVCSAIMIILLICLVL